MSAESEPFFDFIIHLYHACDGKWGELSDRLEIPNTAMMRFLDFAAMFLGNMGNFYVSKDIEKSRLKSKGAGVI